VLGKEQRELEFKHERLAFEAHLAQEESNSKDFVKIADDGKTYVSS
jgi:hypothetical protein